MLLKSRTGDLISALKFVMFILPGHVLKVTWWLKLGIGGTSWSHGTV